MDNVHDLWSRFIHSKPRKSVSQPPLKGSRAPPVVTTSETAKNATLLGLKAFKDSIDGIPFLGPLKGSIAALLAIIETIEQKHGVEKDLLYLNRRARVLTERILQPLIRKHDVEIPTALKERLEAFSSGIQKVVDATEPLKRQGSISAVINAPQHSQTLSELSSTINELLSHFTLDQQINNEILAHREKLTKHVQSLPHVPASYNSNQHESVSKSSRRRSLAPGTAQGIMNVMDTWIDSDSGPQILIVHGLAGVGKSTLAQTICESRDSPENTGRKLGASFFFIRNLYEKSENFFPTLAFQLAERDPSYIPHLGHYLASILSIDSKPPQTQFQEMIVKPLSHIPASPASRSLIVIDALDECNIDGAELILKLLTGATSELLPKVLITCRLEAHLRAALDLRDNVFEGNFQQFVLVDTMPLIDPHDIEDYIQSELEAGVIAREFPNCEWNMTENDLLALQSAAGNLFIMASTMVEFIKDDDVYNPTGQLKVLLRDLRREELIETSPYTRLDLLYATILRSSITRPSAELLQRYHNVVGTIIFLQEPLSVPDLAALIGLTAPDVDGTIRKLSSVINTNNAIRAPQLYHISFTDFLTDPRRCGNDTIGDKRFFINTNERHAWIAERCLDVIIDHITGPNFLQLNKHEVHKNRNDIPNLEARIQSAISPKLLYACRYWAGHLSLSTQREGALVDKLNQFAFNHLLKWVEVLGWAGRLVDARTALELALKWVAFQSEFPSLYDMFYDAQRFLHVFYVTISNSPTHIYSSALPSSPSTSLIFQTYFNKFNIEASMAVQILRGQPDQWPMDLAVLAGHTNKVNGAIFSTDGKRIASTSDDGTVRLWDGVTGEPIAELNGQQSGISTIDFSSDGKRLASVSLRYTVQLWDGVTGEYIAESNAGRPGNYLTRKSTTFSPDNQRLAFASYGSIALLLDAATGKHIAELKGYSEEMMGIVFSSDSRRLASFNPEGVWLWDGATGESIAHLESPADIAVNVVFSPDGKRLASSFYVGVVGLWDGVTGDLVAVLKGHRDITPLEFSPDSKRFVSASSEHTLWLWDSVTGGPIADLKGHKYSIQSFAFSSDGKRLTSFDRDTVRLWDGVTGESIAELEGHDRSSARIMFSPDGKRLALSSREYNVCLWDGVTGKPIAKSEAIKENWSRSSLMFSSDSKRLAFASDDHMISLWDSVSGEPIAELKGHQGQIQSLAFSSDGKRLASASDDNTIRLWDATTRVHTEGPHRHHDTISSIAFSSDSKRVASLSKKTVQLWDGLTGEHIAELQNPQSQALCVALSPDGRRLASAHTGRSALLWDGITGQRISGLQGHRDEISYIAFSSDGKRLVSASIDETIQIWDGITGAHISEHPFNLMYFKSPSQSLLTSRSLMISNPKQRGSYIFSLKEDSDQSNIPLFWIPAWMLVHEWWPLPSGGIFIAGKQGQMYILAPVNDS